MNCDMFLQGKLVSPLEYVLKYFFQEAVNLSSRCPVILLRCEGSGDEVVQTTNAICKASD